MKIKIILLSLVLLVASLHAQLLTPTVQPEKSTCVPSSLQYLANTLGYRVSLSEWTRACQTGENGTDMDSIIPAWMALTNQQSALVPVYVVPKVGVKVLDNKMESFRLISNEERPIRFDGVPYLWVGMHEDYADGTKQMVFHCAVVRFYKDHVHMVNPNSVDHEGKMLEENFDYKAFFVHTLLVFDTDFVFIKRGQTVGS